MWAHASEYLELPEGEELKLFLTLYSKDFRLLREIGPNRTLSLWPEPVQDDHLVEYHYLAKVEGLYDWHVDRNHRSPYALLQMMTLLDAGRRIACWLEIESPSDVGFYMGFGSLIEGTGSFSVSLHGLSVTEGFYTIRDPLWLTGMLEARCNFPDAQQTSQRKPSKSERKRMRAEHLDL